MTVMATNYIEPGSPWENPFVESFNGRLRDELLNIEEFGSITEAKVLIEGWRQKYRGRDGRCWPPPAQIPACASTHWAPDSGFGCEAFVGPGVGVAGAGRYRSARRNIRFQLIRVFWLRRRSAPRQSRMISLRNALTWWILPGTE